MPVLWDKEDGVIVSNESADIVRILNDWADGDLYPPEKRAEIDELNEWIYSEFQNGVYRAGFARSQEAYEEAFRGVFTALDRLEQILGERATWPATRSPRPTGACCRRCCASTPSTTRTSAATAARLIEYPNLLRYTTDLFHQPHVAQTFALDEIKRHYYTTHDELNPKRIIPAGPLDLGFTSA